jgi:hypothetical protein
MVDTTTSVPDSEALEEAAENREALTKIADFADQYYQQLASQTKDKLKEIDMAEVMTPGMIMGMGGNSGDGLFGGGGGGGLIGGLILGSLLRQGGRGGLFGGEDGGAVIAGGGVTNQGLADMSLMNAIGQVDKAVAVSTAAMEASQANQTIGITNQFNNVTGSLANRIDGVKDVVNSNAVVLMQQLNAVNTQILTTANDTQTAVYNDGDKTRALITSQYELNLQRQLADANAAIIELRSREFSGSAARGVEVTTTNNINQMQQQQQQQAQYSQLANLIWSLGQNITATNAAINVGSGTQTASPANNNTNIR